MTGLKFHKTANSCHGIFSLGPASDKFALVYTLRHFKPYVFIWCRGVCGGIRKIILYMLLVSMTSEYVNTLYTWKII